MDVKRAAELFLTELRHGKLGRLTLERVNEDQKVCPNEYEHQYWPLEKLIVGIDEAGRGPLAGPLTVAGVVFPIGYENLDIYDSKSISEKKA